MEAILYGHMAAIDELNYVQNCLPRLINPIGEPLLFYILLLGPPNVLLVTLPLHFILGPSVLE